MLNFPVGGNLIPCVPNLQVSSFLGIWSVQVTSCWHYEDQKIYLKCLHKGMLYSFIQFFKERKFRIKACLPFWNCCPFKEPIHNFLLFLFSSSCVAAFQNFSVVFWICYIGIKQWCWFFISLSSTHLGSYSLKTCFFGDIHWGYRLEFNLFSGPSGSLFLRMQSVLWIFICSASWNKSNVHSTACKVDSAEALLNWHAMDSHQEMPL